MTDLSDRHLFSRAQGADDVEHLLAFDVVVHEAPAASGFDDVFGAQLGELLRQGGLAHADLVFEFAHATLAIHQQAENGQTLAVRQRLEYAHDISAGHALQAGKPMLRRRQDEVRRCRGGQFGDIHDLECMNIKSQGFDTTQESGASAGFV